MLAMVNSWSFVGPQNKIGHPVHRYKQLQVPVLSDVLLLLLFWFFFVVVCVPKLWI